MIDLKVYKFTSLQNRLNLGFIKKTEFSRWLGTLLEDKEKSKLSRLVYNNTLTPDTLYGL